jgi:YVTN family beta-propeller protein
MSGYASFSPGLLLLAVLLVVCRADTPKEQSEPHLRRPIALALADIDGKQRLLVANRDSGTISVVDTRSQKVQTETKVGRRLSDMAISPIRDLVLVTDEAAGELVHLEYRDGVLRESGRQKAGVTPVSVRFSADGRFAAVACLWPRQLVVLQMMPRLQAMVDLPFAPRRLLAVPDSPRMIVADAFGGKLAVVDLQHGLVESVRDLAAHNIRGMTLDRLGQSVLLAHQTIQPQGHTVAGDIRSGNVVNNVIRKIPLADLLDPGVDILRNERTYSLGDVEQGAGDPTELAETNDGTLVVALAGVGEVVVGRPEQVLWTRLAVGNRPTALALEPPARRAYVANTFSDSVSVVDLDAQKTIAEIRLGAAPAPTAAQRGEMLFHDARLSLEGWYSCHSCHSDGHTSGRLNDNLSDGSFGTPKRVLSLLATKDTGPWAWNGKMPDLQTQVRSSITSTMQGSAPTDQQVEDLVAYLQTPPPPPSLSAVRDQFDAESHRRGRHVFTVQKCATCHTPPSYTSPKTYDVGLRDELGGDHFNPPSLRGVSQGGPYFHDGRARTLEEVFTRYRHQLSGELQPADLRDLLQFLSGL